MKVKLPKVNLPKVTLPKVKVPKVTIPKVTLPKMKKIQFNRSSRTDKPSKPFIDDVKSIFRLYRGQMIWISVLSGFLLFLLNILIWVSMYGNTLNESLKDKLWMYFYLKDDVESEGQLYKKVISLRDQLEAEWLKVKFFTKEDAMDFMNKRLPELTWSLQKFWMTNPLPATLYVTLPDISKYDVLKNVMLENSDIIVDVQDINQLEDLKTQEARILNVIRLSNFVQILSLTLIVVIAAVIISFVIFFLRTIFNTFWHDIQVKKLLWASKSQIIMPFMWIIGYAIIGGFVVSLLLTLVSLWTFDYYMTKLFSTTLTSTLFANWWMILLMFVLEIIIILGLIIGVSYIFVSRLHKKLK